MTVNLGTNLTGVADWEAGQPFNNLIYSARHWTAVDSLDAVVDPFTFTLNRTGYPAMLPPGIKASTVMNTNMVGLYRTGRYLVSWEGAGTIEFGYVNVISQSANNAVIEKPVADELGIYLAIATTNPSNPIQNIVVVHESLAQTTNPFNPRYLDSLRFYKTLRFMDWGNTNGNTLVSENDSSLQNQFAYGFSVAGVPIIRQVQLCNRLNANGWFCIPHLANDAYATWMAQLIFNNLKPGLKCYIEYSNECWNDAFQQTHDIRALGENMFGTLTGSASDKYYGFRSMQVMDIFRSVFASRPTDLLRVFGVQTAFLDRYQLALEGLPVGRTASSVWDVYAVAPYLGNELGLSIHQPKIAQWMAEPDGGLSKVFSQLRRGRLLTTANEPEGYSLAAMRKILAHHRTVTQTLGLTLVAYEGGQHLNGIASEGTQDNDALTNLLTSANRSPEMGRIYRQLFKQWEDFDGDLFCHFNNIGEWTRFGSWSALENLDDVTSPKFLALRAIAGGATTSPPVTPPTPQPPTPPVTPPPVTPPPALLKITIPYLQNSNIGNSTQASVDAVYGDSYIASGAKGVNPDVEVWNIKTIPDTPRATKDLLELLKSSYGYPFIWLNKPTGAKANRYWVNPQKIRWVPNNGMASLELTVERYRAPLR